MTEIKIVRGDPDDTELAALLVVIAALGAAANTAPVERTRPAPWHRPARYRSPGAGFELWSR